MSCSPHRSLRYDLKSIIKWSYFMHRDNKETEMQQSQPVIHDFSYIKTFPLRLFSANVSLVILHN